MLAPTEAFELLSHSAQLLERLEAARAELSKEPARDREKQWLDDAQRLVADAREGADELVERALRLGELEGLRGPFAAGLQQLWVDSLERLAAGITFHAGSRAPILEALFPKLKLAAVRKASVQTADAYAAELEKRLGGTYVKRMLAHASFEFAGPVLEQVRAAHARWKAASSPEPLPMEQAQALQEELAAAAERLVLPVRQAKLLAEAALAPLPEAFERSGIGAKVRRRATVKAEEAAPALEAEPLPAPEEEAADEPAEVEAEPAEEPADAPPKKARAGKQGKPVRQARG